MKKITLLVVASFILVGSMAYASENPVFSDNTDRRAYSIDYRDAEPIIFKERGIEFMLFPNGEFDFNTRPSGPRHTANGTSGAPGTRGYYGPSGRGVRVEHDNFGRVRRVGNVYINYDAFGRVKRIGSIYMSYNSFAVTKVGNMRIVYDRRGRIVDVYGFINATNSGYYYNPRGTHYSNDHDDYGYDDDDNGDYDDDYDENDYYYYRKDGTKVKMSDEDIKEIKVETLEVKKDK
ncbi:MAG TPA: hypothetical protein VK164_03420 [Flavobacterium sp.]|uniref:hypothetical protein n=1 Tax=Flavobacterium sp. TaxID=239 RepID=UPI002B4B5F06|nr:hypothetical protein [Flavobacterium sp.]HLO72962.1 hypothetical protein [Flavobacterium sp.]